MQQQELAVEVGVRTQVAGLGEWPQRVAGTEEGRQDIRAAVSGCIDLAELVAWGEGSVVVVERMVRSGGLLPGQCFPA